MTFDTCATGPRRATLLGMKTRDIRFGAHAFPFRHGFDCTREIADRLLALGADRYVLVVDEVVAQLHLEPVARELGRRAPVAVIALPAGEPGKSLATAGRVIEEALARGMTRRSCVVAMGGGVIGNIAGLTAALAFRGVRLVHLPTTLMAALDAVLSLKQAVNASLGKNLIGTFYTPTEVLVDHRWFGTLPERERRSGLCEMVKNALAIVPERITALSTVLRPDCELDAGALRWLVDFGVDAKLSVMKDDEKERGEGLVLEYGHTIGHALELAAPGVLSHGEAVGVGMLCAAEIAHAAFGLDAEALETHRAMLARIGVTKSRARAIPTDEVLRLVRFDNKRGYGAAGPDEIPMILLGGLGLALRDGAERGARPLVPVPLAAVEPVVRSLAAPASSAPPRAERGARAA